MDGLRYSPDDPYYRLGPVHTCLYVRVRETGDCDLFHLCPISDFAKKTRGRRPISDEIGKTRQKEDWRSVGPLVRLLWRALTPLRLPRARSPGMGEGGDWWS